MLDVMELAEAFEALEDRARAEPALNQYRVAGAGPEALNVIPTGWFVSDVIASVATEGGWWPGEWQLALGLTCEPFFESGKIATEDAGIHWIAVGTVWERDWFHAPVLRHPTPEAPLLGFSSQALWQSLEFPTEVALLESFIVTYDELGLDEHGTVYPMFVDWIASPPGPDEPRGAAGVHSRLRELSADWSSAHPAWSSRHMPMRVEGPWPDSLSTNLAGVEASRIRPWHV